MKQKPVSRSIERIFSVILLVSLLFLNTGANLVSPVQAKQSGTSDLIEVMYMWSPVDNLLLYRSLNSENGGPGLLPYDLKLYDVQTDRHYTLAMGGYGGQAHFSRDGATISFWYNNTPYIVDIEGENISTSKVETDSVPVKGAFSSNNDLLIYATKSDDVRLRNLKNNLELGLGTFENISTLPSLYPEWSPNDQWVAFGAESNSLLISPKGREKSTIDLDLTLPESEFSAAAHYFSWSEGGNSLYDYNGKLIYSFVTKPESMPKSELTKRSFDGNYEILSVEGELFLQNIASLAEVQLTNNKSVVQRLFGIAPQTAPDNAVAEKALADGFDFPVGKPNMVGYNTTAGCWWLQNDASCPGPHPGQDINGNGGGDSDLGDPVYAVANGTVVFSGVGSGTSWGNIIMIEHNLPDGSKVWSQYAHLQNRNVSSGTVSKGDQIGTIGKGYNNRYFAHLHFEIRIQYRAADAWISGWSNDQVMQYYTKPDDYINSHRSIVSPCNPNADQIALFADPNYSGTCVVKGFGNYPNPGSLGIPNDSVSSVRVGNNTKITLCRDDNYAGTCEQLTGDDSDLSNNSIGNDQASSARVESRVSCPSVSGEVKLYDLANCGGDSVTANATGLWSMASTFNDRAESIAIPSGWSARLYQNDNENSNESACFGSTDSNLNDNTFGNGGGVGNNATWMRVYSNTNCTGGNPPVAPSPSSPINAQSFNEGESINLSWTSTGDEYYGEVSGGPGGTLTFGWQTGTSKNIGSQWAGYVYTWRVKARNNYGESGWSFAPTFIVRPGAPGNLSASTASCSQINLSWSDNSGNEEGYKVYRNGSVIATLSSGTTSFQDTGLSQSTNYPYFVRAYRGSVESNSSNTANATTSTCPVSPGTPSNFRVSSSTQTSITLAWDNVSNETGYKIYEWNGSTFVYLGSVGANVTSFTETRSGCGWDEFYEVSAYNGNGESVHANWIHGYTLPCTPVLSVPGNPSINPPNYDLNFGWNSASGATEYLVEWWGGPYTTMQPCGWSSATSCHIGTVISGNTYSWHVKARNTAGESPWSPTWTFTIQPQAFTLTLNKTGSGSGTVTSNPAGINCGSDCSETYSNNATVTLTASPAAGSTFAGWSGGGCSGTGTCTVTMTGAVTVTANFVGNSPRAFSKSSPANGATNQPLSLTLAWAPSAGATSYAYCYDTTNDNTCSNWTANGISTSKALTGLSSNTTYYWHVRAFNSFGVTYANGATNAFWSFSTGSGGPGDFSKSSPSNGATNQPTSLTLTWAPSSGAGTYAYCYDTSNDNACSNWTSNGAATSKALTGLSPNTTYYWHVRAFNSLGARYSNGSTTAFWSFSTGSGAPGAFSKSSPANAATNQPLSLTLTWAPSPGATFYAYCYDTTNDNTCSGWTAIGNTTSKSLTSLSPNTTYYWHIRAFNSLSSTFSNGSSTAYWSFRTGNGAPGAFSKNSPANAATNQPLSLTLTWAPSPGATFYAYCYDTTNDNSCSNWTAIGNATSKVLSGLSPNTTYYWHIRAFNSYSATFSNGSATAFWSFRTGG